MVCALTTLSIFLDLEVGTSEWHFDSLRSNQWPSFSWWCFQHHFMCENRRYDFFKTFMLFEVILNFECFVPSRGVAVREKYHMKVVGLGCLFRFPYSKSHTSPKNWGSRAQTLKKSPFLPYFRLISFSKRHFGGWFSQKTLYGVLAGCIRDEEGRRP